MSQEVRLAAKLSAGRDGVVVNARLYDGKALTADVNVIMTSLK